MTLKEIQEIIKLVSKSNLTEFKMKKADFELAIRTKKFHKLRQKALMSPAQTVIPIPSQAPTPPAPKETAPAPAPAPVKEANESAEQSANLLEIKSPIVGTFYRSSSPDKPVFAKVGDKISAGQTVCIVEAMKLFNEIESEISGKIVKVMVEDASPVEYDQVLFLVDPS